MHRATPPSSASGAARLRRASPAAASRGLPVRGERRVERALQRGRVEVLADQHEAARGRLAVAPAAVEIAVEAPADALHDEPHRHARQRGEALHAIDRVRLDERPERAERGLARAHPRLDDDRVELVVMVIGVVGRAVMIVPQMDRLLGRGVQPEQRREIELAAPRAHELHLRRDFVANRRLDGGERRVVEQIGLVDDHEIGGRQLIGEQLVQRRFVIEIRVRAALRVDGGGVLGELAARGGGRVDHGQHRVDREAVLDRRPVERLHERLGQREAGGLDQHVIDVRAALDELLHHRIELFLHGAAQAPVRELVEPAVDFAAGFVAADAAALQDLAVDAEFAELVDDHGDPAAARVLEDVAQERRLAAAEEARDDRHGNFAHLHGRSVGRYRVME
ncbi:hypothetical protein Y046_3860 [Burkholderia pseudomallei MSHR2990]|nr:hypothetical protein Y046_3860 [Burkholderia pseudomallei MSHR2990]